MEGFESAQKEGIGLIQVQEEDAVNKEDLKAISLTYKVFALIYFSVTSSVI